MNLVLRHIIISFCVSHTGEFTLVIVFLPTSKSSIHQVFEVMFTSSGTTITRRFLPTSLQRSNIRRFPSRRFPVLAATFQIVALSAFLFSEPVGAFSTCSAASTCRANTLRHPAMLNPAVSAGPLADITLQPVANGAVIQGLSPLKAGSLWTPSEGVEKDNLDAVVIFAVRRPG